MWCFWSVYYKLYTFVYLHEIYHPFERLHTLHSKVPSGTAVLPPNPEERLLLSNQTRPYLCQGQTHWQRGFLFRQANGEISTKDLSQTSENPNQRPTWWRKTTSHTMDKNTCYFVLLEVVTWNVVRCIQQKNFSKSPISQLNESNKRLGNGNCVSFYSFWVFALNFHLLELDVRTKYFTLQNPIGIKGHIVDGSEIRRSPPAVYKTR